MQHINRTIRSSVMLILLFFLCSFIFTLGFLARVSTKENRAPDFYNLVNYFSDLFSLEKKERPSSPSIQEVKKEDEVYIKGNEIKIIGHPTPEESKQSESLRQERFRKWVELNTTAIKQAQEYRPIGVEKDHNASSQNRKYEISYSPTAWERREFEEMRRSRAEPVTFLQRYDTYLMQEKIRENRERDAKKVIVEYER